MARGNKIVVTADPKGQYVEGVIQDTSLPGTCMQIQSGQTTDILGRLKVVAAAPGADGKKVPQMILLEDAKQGKTTGDAYVAGTYCQMYIPAHGEEMNIRVGEVAGTGNSYNIGDRVINDAEDGIYVPEAGSPEDTPFEILEKITQVAGSSLVYARRI